MSDIERSCADCGVVNCKGLGKEYPPFCQTVQMNPDTKKKAMECYEEEENRKIMQTAAQVEYEGYCRWCRVEETIEFAKRMGYHKLGIACCAIGPNMCNPILQAKLLEEAETDFNIVVGLCVGHDSLFYKYTKALTTTLIVKDRVTGHNPAAALYTADSYYKKRMMSRP